MLEKYFKDITNIIDSFIIYKNIKENDVVKNIREICTCENISTAFAKLVSALMAEAEKLGFEGNILKKCICYAFLTDENTFSLLCENNKNVENTSLYNLALKDIEKMLMLADFDILSLEFPIDVTEDIIDYKPVLKKENDVIDFIITLKKPQEVLNAFIDYYKVSGCGVLAKFKAFKYNERISKLVGIEKNDPITFEDLVGYEEQKQQLISNTEAFLNGYPANNVLLAGARGTGKSSSVKALVNAYYDKGLRIIEITKEQISFLPDLLAILKKRGRNFIIFIDDLSFDEQEIQYKQMKSLLDGGTESRPENVLFYATSNRRHLIQEKWSDRASGSKDAEIHTTDTLNEKLSLADRFGLTITYPQPTPKEYVNMVHTLAEKYNIKIDGGFLEKEAMKWELTQKGKSGRTAKQFINHILWETRIE